MHCGIVALSSSLAANIARGSNLLPAEVFVIGIMISEKLITWLSSSEALDHYRVKGQNAGVHSR